MAINNSHIIVILTRQVDTSYDRVNKLHDVPTMYIADIYQLKYQQVYPTKKLGKYHNKVHQKNLDTKTLFSFQCINIPIH